MKVKLGTISNCPYCNTQFIITSSRQKYCCYKHANAHYYILNKDSINQKNKNIYNKNKEKRLKQTRNYYLKNKEKMDAWAKEWRRKYWKENKESLKLRYDAYRLKNPEKIAGYQKKHYENNKKKIFAQQKQRYQTNNNFKLRSVISNRIRVALKREVKNTKTVDLLGCSIPFLKKYLESKFENWMNWKNHGIYNKNFKTWQIDHIIPCSSFDLMDIEQQKKCFHYTNLQPLLSIHNLKKNNKLNYEME